MAGIYIHIPFCKKACHYCDFHFSTSLKYKEAFIEALLKEIDLTRDYLLQENSLPLIETVYFGGGTPSLLNKRDLDRIFDELNTFYQISPVAEITLEANPDDLTGKKLKELSLSPINRLSIGIQSFFERDLVFMNRAHNAEQAHRCIREAKEAGFDNITIDLIYGTPGLSDADWIENLHTAFSYGIPHISCYCLTVEEKTALAHFIKKKQVPELNDEQSLRQFQLLMDEMTAHGYEQYEISNFSKPGFYSKHNSNYWKNASYLGLGPSAHSYDGNSRQWNIANNQEYIRSLQIDKIPCESEELSVKDRFNEYMMTSLRTSWGIDAEYLRKAFGEPFARHFSAAIQTFLETGELIRENTIVKLTQRGKFIADKISAILFYT